MGKPAKKIGRVPGNAGTDSKNVGMRLPRKLQGIASTGAGDEARPLWRLSLLDLDHRDGWSWDIDGPTMSKIVTFMTEMERLTWTEIKAQITGGKQRRGPKHKPIPVQSLCPTAQRRLQELQLDDWEHLFRFRTGNMERLWGIVADEGARVFYPIWWDPDHRVCPSSER